MIDSVSCLAFVWVTQCSLFPIHLSHLMIIVQNYNHHNPLLKRFIKITMKWPGKCRNKIDDDSAVFSYLRMSYF